MAINILFLGGSKRVSIAETFVDAGKTLGQQVKIFAYELDRYEPIAAVGTIVQGLKWNDPKIIENLRMVISEYNIHIVLPFVDIATLLCAQLQMQLPTVHFCVSSERICRVLFDKRKSNEWFLQNDFLIPSTQITPPLVAKRITGSGAKGMKFLRSRTQLHLFLEEESETNYFLQEMIEGEEFSVDCYVSKNGEIVSIVPRKRLEVTNGEATRSVTVKDDQIVNQATEILRVGEFNGPVTIQFIRQSNTQLLYLIEINPRMGSGIVTSIWAGANTCLFVLNDYLKLQNKAVCDWKENILMTRAFKEYYFYATDN